MGVNDVTNATNLRIPKLLICLRWQLRYAMLVDVNDSLDISNNHVMFKVYSLNVRSISYEICYYVKYLYKRLSK